MVGSIIGVGLAAVVIDAIDSMVDPNSKHQLERSRKIREGEYPSFIQVDDNDVNLTQEERWAKNAR